MIIKLVAALIVFVAYTKRGYIRPWDFISSLWSYHKEQKSLKGEILTLNSRYKVPLGTMMCSLDPGVLPIDVQFPLEMAKLRTEFGSKIAYCGKFAVWPGLEKKGLGNKVFTMAVHWVCDNDCDLAVMIVHPDHAPYYVFKGAEVISRTDYTPGLRKAPAVLLAFKSKQSPRIKRVWVNEQERRAAQASGEKKAAPKEKLAA